MGFQARSSCYSVQLYAFHHRTCPCLLLAQSWRGLPLPVARPGSPRAPAGRACALCSLIYTDIRRPVCCAAPPYHRHKRQRKDESGGGEGMEVEGNSMLLRDALGGVSSDDEDADMQHKLRAAALGAVAGLDAASQGQEVTQAAVLIEVVVLPKQNTGSYATADGQGDRYDEIISATGRYAAKAIVSAAGGDSHSKITAAFIMAQDAEHVRLLKDKAAAINFVAYTATELLTCGDPRAMSLSNDIFLLQVDTKYFPKGVWNFTAESHREWLGRQWLSAIQSLIPVLDPSKEGLTLEMQGVPSLQCTSSRVTGSRDVSRAVNGIIIAAKATTTASRAADPATAVTVTRIPHFLEGVVPKEVQYAADNKHFTVGARFAMLKSKDYAYTMPLRVGYCPFHAKVCDPTGLNECSKMKHHRKSIVIAQSLRRQRPGAGGGGRSKEAGSADGNA